VNTQELIDQVRAVYRNAAVYVDRGRLALVDADGNPRDTDWQATFRTAFERPGRFEFVFQPSSGLPHSIRAERGQSPRLVFRGKLQPCKTLELAVASLTGVTSGVGHTMARLLMPGEIGGVELWNLGSGRAVGQRRETIDGEPCSVVELSYEQTEVAIRERDFAIVRIARRFFGAVHGTRTANLRRTISYEPIIYADTPSDIGG
jgi:hypothetical protein